MTRHGHKRMSGGLGGWTRRGTAMVNRGGRAAVSPPALADGKVRCPACRNAVSLTPRQYLRRHSDLFGNECWNKAVELAS
jgi:hypothetical protein